MIWKGIIGLCSSNTAITNKIGSSPMRLFPVLLPQGLSTFPAVAGQSVSINPTDDFDEESDFDYVSMDFHFYAKDDPASGKGGLIIATETAEVFRKELNGASGIFNGVEFNDVRFQPSGTDDYLDELELYTYSTEFNFNTRVNY